MVALLLSSHGSAGGTLGQRGSQHCQVWHLSLLVMRRQTFVCPGITYPLHALGQQVVGEEGVEGGVAVVLVGVRGAPDTAAQPRAAGAAAGGGAGA